MRTRRIGVGAVVAIVTAEAVGQWLSHRLPRLDRRKRTAIIVLGYRAGRHDGANLLQRWRVHLAARTLDALDDGWLILSGGVTGRGDHTEAEQMARHATDLLGVAAERIQLEPDAASTWENVQFGVPLAIAGGAEQIVLVSDPFHVTRARRYLARQFPDLAPAVAAAVRDRPLRHAWIKPILLADLLTGLVVEQVSLRREQDG